MANIEINDKDKILLKRKRIIAIISLIIVVIIFGLITWFIIDKFQLANGDIQEFKKLIDSYGAWKWLIIFGLQILQVVIAFIPGELIEIGSGFVLGPLWGTIVCLIGVTIASSIVFLIVKKFGIKFVELFVDIEKINNLKFINNESKLVKTVFILFLIPGTPKDILTYFVGLTRMTLKEFLIISLFARIPSILSSTIGGHYIADGNKTAIIIIFGITALISGLGLLLYNYILKKKNNKNTINK